MITGHTTYRYVFTACCDTNDVLYFQGTGTITGAVPGVFVYQGSASFPDGNGKSLLVGKCYTVTQELYTDSGVPLAPPNDKDLLSVTDCNDELCPDCNQVCGQCPDGYVDIGNDECEKVETSPASYSGTLLNVGAGDKSDFYCDSGLRLYTDITAYTLPLVGNGTSNSNYAVKDSSAVPIVVPILTSTLKNSLWGFGTSFPGCGAYNGRLNNTGIWATGIPDDQELCFEFCVNPTETKQYTIGLAGDNKVKLYIDNVLYVFLNGTSSVNIPFRNWHVFPVTLTSGKHTIRLCGLNLGSSAAFGAEIYDLSLTELQDPATGLIDPATGYPDCGSVPADLEPYILFSTADMIGTQVPDPANPGVWSCPDGSNVDYCQGTPQCTITNKTKITPCPCYFLIPCDGSLTPFYSTSSSLSPYVGTNTQVIVDEQTVCVWVFETNPNETCLNPININLPASPQSCVDDCDTRCYYVGGSTGIIAYVDADGNRASMSAIQASPYVKICSKSFPYVTPNPNLVIVDLGPCDPVTGCPILCFKLTNCDNPAQVIYSQSQNLISYSYNNQIVKIVGEDGCWIVEQSQTCECAVDVTVTQFYSTCLDCTGYKNYKLTNCDTGAIKYTTNDLEMYLDQVVEISENGTACPGCWSVTLFTQQVTVSANVVVTNSFINCKECLQDYWLLQDCAHVQPDIITISDLSVYEDEYIRLTWCPDICWHVTSTRLHTNTTIVFVEENYISCPECILDALPCKCVSVKNTSIDPITFEYYDCTGAKYELTLNANEISDKICIKEIINPPAGLVETDFGNCTGTSPDFMCPVVPLPKRIVTPGYDTPGCSPEYFETVMCNFASWIYGEVLKERYGISPCCSEDAVKWEIKEQLLEFTAGLDPEYDCTPASTCCAPTCSKCTSSTNNCDCNCK